MIFQYERIERDRFLLEEGCHPRDALLLLLSGSFSLKIGAESATLSRADAAFFAAGVPFTRHVREPITAIYIQFSKMPDLCERAVYFGSERTRGVLDALERAVLSRTVSEEALMHFVLDIFYADALLSPKTEEGTPYAVRRFLESAVAEPLSLSFLAQKFGYTEQGLIAAFKRAFGISPMAFLSDMRLARAEWFLLQAEPIPIARIAELCGFANLYYFSNSFKKKNGVSPTTFRGIHRI